ncbi:decaprenyl-phosphate phosphoribosyltransferase [bacterium]|nr:decaprenyl-phosphate phosphoribosyltransferase [bacterium]
MSTPPPTGSLARTVLESMRPRQWTKNLILLAGVIFAQMLDQPGAVVRAVAGVLVFCIASGAVYIFNDISDVAQDRIHPHKRRRPIASGRLPVPVAWRAWAGLVALSILLGWALGWAFVSTLLLFYVWNWTYSRLLKKVPIVDVIGIGISFVIRALAGVMVLIPVDPAVSLSMWLLICPFFLSLFLGFCKRRNELIKLADERGSTRPVLLDYTETVLNAMIGASFGLTLAAYAVYTVWPSTVAHFGTRSLVWTTGLVFLGLWRYLYLVFKEGRGGRPHEILLNDPILQMLVLAWILVFVMIIGMGQP